MNSFNDIRAPPHRLENLCETINCLPRFSLLNLKFSHDKIYYREVHCMDKVLFGLKVKIVREHRKLSQSQLAEMVDIADNTMSNIETGKNYPHINTIIAISKALDVSLIFLLSDEKDATEVCLNEIYRCLFIMDKSISEHLKDYIDLCLKLDVEMKDLKKSKELVFDWFKPKD